MRSLMPLLPRFGRCFVFASFVSAAACSAPPAATPTAPAKKLPAIVVGEKGAFPLKAHLESADIAAGKYTPAQFIESGADLFHTPFNGLDGVGVAKSKAGTVNRFVPIGPTGPSSTSCGECHNEPFPSSAGLAHSSVARDPEADGKPPFNVRSVRSLYGDGLMQMLAEEMTEDLQAIRNATPPGAARPLVSKGISFGRIARAADGSWITSGVEGLAAPSLATAGPASPPSLIVRPFHQAGNVVSLRQFSNNAFNHHHGIQSTERFGINTDSDGDGVVNEMTRADVTAVSIFQAAMAVPGRVIPDDPEIEEAVLVGEKRFAAIGCTTCHVPALPLDRRGWVFTEPNPFNPAAPPNLQAGQAPTLSVDLSSDDLPQPRLRPSGGVVMVPAFTDLKLHDITTGVAGDPNIEPLDMNQPAGSPGFFAGNRRFLTRKLWGAANEPPFFHHGMFTTLRQAIKAHDGEARAVRIAFEALAPFDQDAIVEFLKTLQVLPPGTRDLVVDERGHHKDWPPRSGRSGS